MRLSLEMAFSFLLSCSLHFMIIQLGILYNHIIFLNYLLRMGAYLSFMLILNSLYFFTQEYEEEDWLLINGLGVVFLGLTNVGAIAKGITGI